MTAHEKSISKAEQWVLKSISSKRISPRELQEHAPATVRSAVRSAVVGLVASGRVTLSPDQKIGAQVGASSSTTVKAARHGRSSTK